MAALKRFYKLFPCNTSNLIGMVHVGPLPGTPLHRPEEDSVCQLIERACRETEIYSRLGVDSILIENMHDLPYIAKDEVGHEVTAAMTAICREARKVFPKEKPVGIMEYK